MTSRFDKDVDWVKWQLRTRDIREERIKTRHYRKLMELEHKLDAHGFIMWFVLSVALCAIFLVWWL